MPFGSLNRFRRPLSTVECAQDAHLSENCAHKERLAPGRLNPAGSIWRGLEDSTSRVWQDGTGFAVTATEAGRDEAGS